MKKSVLIKIICLMIIIAVSAIGVILIIGFADGLESADALVISSGTSAAVYNGEELTDSSWKLISGELEEGDRLDVTVSGTQTNVGVSENHVSARVLDRYDNDVTRKYTVKYKPGTLTVQPRSITVTADSDMKAYDGTPLTSPGYDVTAPLPMLDGHVVLATVEGSITEVGNTDNRVAKVTVTNARGQDVSRNYSITAVSGKLIVYSVDAIVIESGSFAAPYTGEAIRNTEWHMTSGALKPGDTLTVDVTGSQTEVGTSLNTIVAKITNAEGKDVTSTYEIVLKPGELRVIKQKVTITSFDDEKVYDGAPLIRDGYEISPEGIENRFIFEIKIVGSQTEIGISKNTIECTVRDGFKNDITANFDIELIEGELVVTDENGNAGGGEGGGGGAGGSGGDGDKEDDGSEGGSGSLNMGGGLGGGGGNNGNEVFFTLFGLEKDSVYLRMKSFGDFNGKDTWSEASEYGILTEDMLSPYYITALALDNSGLSPTTLSITPNGGVFALPYYTIGGGFEPQHSDVNQIGYAASQYNVSYFNWDATSGIVLPKRYREYEEAYRKHVYLNYLNIDSDTEKYMLGIIDERGFTAKDPDIINKVASFIKSSAKYNLQYDTEMDNADNMVIAFLSEYKEGVCRHYASAATLLFRTLGIPARYTIGFAGAVEANTETTVTAENYHAWVEVYVNGIGWINVEVTPGGSGGGMGSDQPIRLDITPVYTGDYYDFKKYTETTPLRPKEEVVGFAALEREGYTYSVKVSGEIYELGIVKTGIEDFKIYDPFGNLVYDLATGMGGDKFVINYNSGQLQLYYSVLTFSSSGFNKTYDGIAYEVTGESCTFVSGELIEGYSYEIKDGAVLVNAERAPASFKVVIRDGFDVVRNDYYRIVYDYGEVVISAREITVKAQDASKPYDGTELVCSELVYDELALADGDNIDSYTVTGSQTNVGKSSNVITKITIKNKDGTDVTANYVIKTVEGTLHVTIP